MGFEPTDTGISSTSELEIPNAVRSLLGLRLLARTASDVLTVEHGKEFVLEITGLVLDTTGLTLVLVGLQSGFPKTDAMGGGIGWLMVGFEAGCS